LSNDTPQIPAGPRSFHCSAANPKRPEIFSLGIPSI
jgi:hypothetical protein